MILRMVILPGLTSTRKEGIPAFLKALSRSRERHIALFPTCLGAAERKALYLELEAIKSLRIPHVHLRADCDPSEIAYLARTFGTEAFNIHPRASSHPFASPIGEFAQRVFVENVDVPVEDAELEGEVGPGLGGICPDFSHLENARLFGRDAYVRKTLEQLRRFPVGCCHLSAIRVGVPNSWGQEWDHHAYAKLSDFDFLASYRAYLPASWASLELENSFEEQLEARAYITGLLRTKAPPHGPRGGSTGAWEEA
jgi:hypothetical protein